jgi:hypothetical protein
MLFLLLLQQPANLFSECVVPGDPDMLRSFGPTVRPGGPSGWTLRREGRNGKLEVSQSRVRRSDYY